MKNYQWNKKQAKALWESAEHWLQNWADPINARYWADDCACCRAYLDLGSALNECAGCPISQHTGKEQCADTPYYDVRAVLMELQSYDDPFDDLLASAKLACGDEYRFLVELALGGRGPKS
jgi:hypothetical protein